MEPTFNSPDDVIAERFTIDYWFDTMRTNPNGDPDMDNVPRTDPHDGRGLVSPQSLKRKQRDFTILTCAGIPGYEIHVSRRAVLNRAMEEVCKELGLAISSKDVEFKDPESDGDDDENPESEETEKKGKKARGGKKEKRATVSARDAQRLSDGMAKRFLDVCMFGGVLSVGVGGNNVTGPIQMSWAESVDPVIVCTPTITRVAVTNEEQSEKQDGRNRGMGQTQFVRYGLYRCEISVSPFEAAKTGLTYAKLEHFLRGLRLMHEVTGSASRKINSRRITVFQHKPGEIGNALDCELFPLSKYELKAGVESPSRYEDYMYSLDKANVPDGVTVWDYKGQPLCVKRSAA
jgi:CRISPR-associated protein Csd2